MKQKEKCGNRIYLGGIYFECQLEKGHSVEECLPDKKESVHFASGHGSDSKWDENNRYFAIHWD